NYLKTDKGWIDLDKEVRGEKTTPGEVPIQYVTFEKDGSVTILEKDGTSKQQKKDGSFEDGTVYVGHHKMTVKADGSFEEEQQSIKVMKDGNWHETTPTSKFSVDGQGTMQDSDGTITRMVKDEATGREFRSRIGEQGGDHYVVKDDQGHTTRIDAHDKPVVVKRGDQQEEKYDECVRSSNGDLKLTRKDGTLEIKHNGTFIRRDKDNQIAEITNSDGERTKFTRSGHNVTGVTTFDAQGKERSKETGKIEVKDDGSYTIELPKADLEARKADGADGTPAKLLRKRDGTEELLDKDGKHVDSDADRLISHYKHFSPEEQRQLRQDLADIDRLPTEKREAVYKSLDKIAHNDDLQKQDPKPKIELTGQQSRELVASLAHQVAHPESI